MIAGSDKLNATSCDTIKAAGGISGWDGEKVLDLVRNPAYNPATDSTKARENLPDEFTFTVNSNADDIYARVTRGDIEEEIAGETPSVLRQYNGSPQLHTNDGDRTWYLTMNLTQPPFDDLHVRRAVNFVVNREALRKSWGGASAGAIATHIAPDAVLDNKLKGYAPYGNGKGDLAKAKAEMKLSKYDKNHDGICDASACKNILTITGDREVEKGFIPALSQNLKSIGIVIKDRVLKDAYTPIQTTRNNIPFSTRAGLGQGLRRRPDVLRPALRRPQHHPAGQHQLLPARASRPRSPRRSASRAASPTSRASTPTSTSAACSSAARASTATRRSTRSSRRRSCRGCPYLWSYAQSVSSTERHEVRVRPVRRDDRLRPRGGQVLI